MTDEELGKKARDIYLQLIKPIIFSEGKYDNNFDENVGIISREMRSAMEDYQRKITDLEDKLAKLTKEYEEYVEDRRQDAMDRNLA